MANNGALAGVISPKMCWSASGNELRLHSIASLEPHAGHGTTGLPAQAVFRFSSEPAQEKRETVRGTVCRSVLAAPPLPAKRTKSPPSSPTLALSAPGAAAAATAAASDAQGTSFAIAGTATGAASPRGSGSPTSAGAEENAARSLSVGAGRNGVRRVVGSSGGGDASPRERGAVAKGAAGKLSVRAVEAVETTDGRTVLVCLVSERDLPSEIHCVECVTLETLQVATGLPILLTSLAIVPRLAAEATLSRAQETRVDRHGGGGSWPDPVVADGRAGDGDGEEVVVAVGGVGGRVTLVGLQLPANPQENGQSPNPAATTQRAAFRSRPLQQQHTRASKTRSAGGVPSEREGVPITSLAAFSVPDTAVDGRGGLRRPSGSRIAMVAAGWSDGSWAVAPCCGGCDGDSSGVGVGVGGGGGGTSVDEGLGEGLEDGGREAVGVASSVAAKREDLAAGDTGGLGPALHFTYQEEAISSGLSRGGHPSKFRLWVSTASGFMCFEVPVATTSSQQVLQPIFRQETSLIAGVRPQSLRAMPVGGGPPLPVMVFASTRLSDGAPVLTILGTDTAIACAAAAGDGSGGARAASGHLSPSLSVWVGGGGDGVDGGLLREGLGEVELSTRCCSKSVFAASPHAVFVHPAGVKAFVCGGGGGGGGGRGGRGGEEGDVAAVSEVPQHTPSFSGNGIAHLKFSMVVAEASLSEAGRLVLRAWEQMQVGDAHEVAAEVERLGLLAFCEPSEEEPDTARHIDALGEASLEHIVGGPENLWGRSFFSREESNDGDNSNPGVLSARKDGVPAATEAVAASGPGGEKKEGMGLLVPEVLLAARLQGAVAMGRGPAVARALTTTVPPFGGEWMLPHARPVQEWAASVALEAWDEAYSLLARLGPDAPSSEMLSERVAVSALDAVARRSRQVERIVEASIERCRQYCEAANPQGPANPAAPGGGPRRQRLRPNAALARQLAAAARLAETAPLLSHLFRAALAAHLAARVASAASWLFAAGLLRRPAASAAGPGDGLGGLCSPAGGGGGGGGGKGVSPELPGLVRPTPIHASVPPMRMVDRLRERSDLVSSEAAAMVVAAAAAVAVTGVQKSENGGKGGDEGAIGNGGCVGGGDGDGAGGDAPGVALVQMSSILRDAFVDADDEDERGEKEGLVGPGLGNPSRGEGRGCAAVRSLLEKGLAVVAYSVMNAAFLRDKAPAEEESRCSTLGPADGAEGEAEERTTLERVEALADEFCEQARMSPESRVQARISWLLDNGTPTAVTNTGTGGGGCPSPRSLLFVSTAAAALLRPRASACLATDPDLVALAGAILARFGGGGDGECGGGGGGGGGGEREAGRQAAMFLPLAEDLLKAAGAAARERLLLTGGRKRPRDSPSPVPFGGGVNLASPDELTAAHGDGHVGSGGQSEHPQKRPTPAKQHQQRLSPAASTPLQQGNDNGASRRDRGCTVWETPRGVGLTPKTPGARRPLPLSAATGGANDVGPGYPMSASSTDHQTRERGQTVWETPQGVGLTPKTPGARGGLPLSTPGCADDNFGSGYSNSVSSTYRQPRERGQTVWETPRGVGLTPTTPGARGGLPLSTPGCGADDDTGSGNSNSASSTYRQPRERGQTVWETPRGVGLTPKTPGARRGLPLSTPGCGADDDTESDFSGSASSTCRQPRERGQTVWETPRGVGLTPKAPGASSQDGRSYAMEASGRKGGYTGGGVEECKGEDAYSAGSAPRAYKQPRARGQTVWDTPRGVGLTPRTTGVAGWATKATPLSAREGCSPAAWSVASGSSAASPGIDGQREMRSYAQGGL